ncbi:MAG: DUF4838 domain-containing protein [Planctomycetota bacterium]|jgi:hypothetical protein
MINFKTFILTGITVITISLSAISGEFIVKNSKPNAQIIIAEKPQNIQKIAAQELQNYILKMTKAKLPVSAEIDKEIPVKIFVGSSKHTEKYNLEKSKLSGGGYYFKSGKDFLLLMGSDEPYKAKKTGEGVLPSSRSDRKRAGKEWSKLVNDKWSSPFMAYFKGYHKELDLWSLDDIGSLNAVNDFLRTLGVEWYLPGEIGEVYPQLNNIALPAETEKIVIPEVYTRNIMFYANQPFMASIDEMMWHLRLGFSPIGMASGHGLDYVLHTEKMRKAHPEYYSLWQGKRQLYARGGKPCLGTAGIKKEMVAFSRFMYDNFDKKIASVMPTDGYPGCNCKLCKKLMTPERGRRGAISDYVWGFVNDVAKELYKTHPDRKVSCYAYASYLLPPKKIKKLSPNVIVGICQHRTNFYDADTKKDYLDIRNGWIAKLPSKSLSIWEYYQSGKASLRLPVYSMKAIADDMKHLKGNSYGEFIECYRNKSSRRDNKPDPLLATKHVDIYLTSRLWWNSSFDVNKMMKKYYTGFWGPAAKEAKHFIEFSEKNWMHMGKDAAICRKALDYLDAIENALKDDKSVYKERVNLLTAYMAPVRKMCAKLEKGRKDIPSLEINSHHGSVPKVEIDGKLDEKFWQSRRKAGLVELQTGRESLMQTTFIPIWDKTRKGSFFLGIICKESDMENLNIKGKTNDDAAILQGDTVHLLLETQSHSYYHVAVNPDGLVFDQDIGNDKIKEKWKSNVKVAAHKGENFWSIEMHFPIEPDIQADIAPDDGIAGRIPTAIYPWFVNICRERPREYETLKSAWSPTGSDSIFNDMRFGKLAPHK